MNQEAWKQARRVLCVRLDSLGDVLMCTPAMRAIKQALPHCTLTLLTSAGGAAAAPYIDDIDAVIEYAAPWMKGKRPQSALSDASMIRLLAERHFDAAVIFTSYSQSALPATLLCHLAGIPLRLAHCRENPYHLLSNWVSEPEPATLVRHQVRRQLDLVSQVGWPADCTRLSFSVPGPAHMAAAIGTQLAELYALTNPQHTPWQVENRLLFHDVPCRFCYKSACPHGHHDCLGKVPPERVVEAVCSLLALRALQQDPP